VLALRQRSVRLFIPEQPESQGGGTGAFERHDWRGQQTARDIVNGGVGSIVKCQRAINEKSVNVPRRLRSFVLAKVIASIRYRSSAMSAAETPTIPST
jgi:hypothetical protein